MKPQIYQIMFSVRLFSIKKGKKYPKVSIVEMD